MPSVNDGNQVLKIMAREIVLMSATPEGFELCA
jgi:hypothetical protein